MATCTLALMDRPSRVAPWGWRKARARFSRKEAARDSASGLAKQIANAMRTPREEISAETAMPGRVQHTTQSFVFFIFMRRATSASLT